MMPPAGIPQVHAAVVLAGCEHAASCPRRAGGFCGRRARVGLAERLAYGFGEPHVAAETIGIPPSGLAKYQPLSRFSQ